MHVRFWSFFEELLPAVQCVAVIRVLKILRCSASLYRLWQITRNLSLIYGQTTCTITVERRLARLVARTVMRHGDAITTFRKSWSPFIQPVPGFEIVECGAKLENGKKKRTKREREEGISPSLPTPLLAVFSAHISLRRPHNLNSWNRSLHFSIGRNDVSQGH